ncbi:MAG TPA: PsiF family protein [Usitatibacter sp.]|nr:PsiF family protein [Usitatibacter sp.]
MSIRIAYIAACIAVSLLATPAARAAAEPEAKAPSSHQARFAACAHESKGLRGEEHQSFMSECLHGSAEPSESKKEAAANRTDREPSAQQSRMKSCNEEAGRRSLHGDERRAFMSSCLKG